MTERATAVAITSITRRTCVGLAVLAISLFATACDDRDPSAEPTTTPRATATAATLADTSPATSPTTASTIPVTPPTTPASLPAPTSAMVPPTTVAITPSPPGFADWVPLIQSFANAINTLYAAPDLARIPEVCPEGSRCEAYLQAQLGDLISQGAHVVDNPPLKVVSAEVVPNSFDGDTIEDSRVVSVDVVFQVPVDAAGRIVDAAGNTIQVFSYTPPPGQTYSSRWTLFRADLNQPWRQSFYEDNLP